jgi:catechol 2,3-dioxygenase-like lactoylglutathione lyase family enzyme
VDDLEKEAAKMVKRGFPVIQNIKKQDGTLMDTYHDTCGVGNVIISLIREPIVKYVMEGMLGNDWKFEHVGFVVRNINEAIKFYRSLGFSIVLSSIILHSKIPDSPRIKMSVLQKSSFIIELFEHVEGVSLWRDFISRHGEGINHISFAVDDLEKEAAKLLKKGFSVANITRKSDGSLEEIYFDTRRVGNVYIALYQGRPRLNYEDNVQALSEMQGFQFQKAN